MAGEKEVSKMITVPMGIAFTLVGFALVVTGAYLITSGTITYSSLKKA